MSGYELQRINAFLAGFARRQAEHTADIPGGFAVFDDRFADSWSHNQVVVDRAGVDPADLPGLVDEVMGERPFRLVSVLDGAFGEACVDPFERAGYRHHTYLVMLHTGAVPADRATEGGRTAEDVDLEAIRAPLSARWRTLLPEAGDAVINMLVDRRRTRSRGATRVQVLGSRAENGEVAAWGDLYLEPTLGIAQVEDLMTAEAHLRRGHADAVLTTALRRAAAAGCGTRFLTADADDWPRHWYERRGFTSIGHSHGFQRT
ncbi:GNAT family N-acetyltransferase [Kitasatospora sp. CM 4170]|uniref:GNAT family N-acetyltransferase n=1 Tax=Kitasatospora sp. CM 4170 TaxID=3075627 RepID=UPI0028B0447B|nr:GNAT family N-acetyltransferase [Kitasatospora sp. CM 4170]WNM43229.1 GNAT family N-acetyltransferase [Kitasatospora sp. CM 4170]